VLFFFATTALKKSPSNGTPLQKRVMGIEPTLMAWEAIVLPLNYTRAKCDDFFILTEISERRKHG
jgi:hypothetical protein